MNCGVGMTEQFSTGSIINDVLDHLVKLTMGHLVPSTTLYIPAKYLQHYQPELIPCSIPRCLMTPLETFSVTCYIISQNELNSFSCCKSLFQLKHLELRGVILHDVDIMSLRGFLEKVADTLETLDLQCCRMKDSQLYALLPALRNFSQLTTVKFYSNKFSMPILKDLLQHTANWSTVNVEQYPAPLECYDDSAQVSVERFAQLCRELMDTLRAIRQPKNISFATEICYTCGERCVYHNGPRLCCCWQ